jgi:desulfoferrodoxin (superoxide reductase-like protein)
MILSCTTHKDNKAELDMYIESWDEIYISDQITNSKFANKKEATEFIEKTTRNNYVHAHVAIGKVFHMNGADEQKHINEIESWLFGAGVEEMVFELVLFRP